ncbi:MAG: PSD1 and planctomycete cytochrome C domain-containing protein [Bryobacteraceae bacterium]|nr:PSD1 and planctomycete cytochrome C domain-containing protein [Bryobacteraceae bacterium]MDW8376588.1 PSD1 and planctomycete cytochrome C domain-containing protein [Bryobacterales bacterium]
MRLLALIEFRQMRLVNWRKLCLLFSPWLVAQAESLDRLEFFEQKVRPVLAKHCFSCHTQNKLGGLEMTSRESLLKGGNSGPAIDVQRPAQSLLVRVLRHTHDRLQMPPAGKLPEEDIDNIERWIARGAVWPASGNQTSLKAQLPSQQSEWWAFRPVKLSPLPEVRNRAWAASPIDRYILAALEQRGLTPVGPASRRDWIKRVSIDLTGLPPSPEAVDSFLRDSSPKAREKVVDRLLASKQFGERWARHWLDVARYSDDLLNSTQDEPYDNAFRYRDWVIEALNEDLPYDLFVKAQIAGDWLEPPLREKLIAGLGFYALSPQFQDDRVDVTGKAFLGLTLGCAQCHDHKFDPIPTQDYYSLLGVFTSTENSEFPLAPPEVVARYKQLKQAHEASEAKLNQFLEKQAEALTEVLAHRTADFIRAARLVIQGADAKAIAQARQLDETTLTRWVEYLRLPEHEHPYSALSPEEFQAKVLEVLYRRRELEEKNLIRLGGSKERSKLASADLLSLPRDEWLLWRDILSPNAFGKFESGLFYYKGAKLEPFLSGAWRAHLDHLHAEVERNRQAIPERYPYYHIIRDREKVRNERVRIRGNAENLGEEAPRRFLSILSQGPAKPFTQGSGRLELAEAITHPANPLTARVAVNRIWHHLFGQGLVRTLNNFGQLGEKPSHPELLDYLAHRLIEQKWSIKALVREMVLTNTYALGYSHDPKAFTADPENRLLWRGNRRRLDVEALRDCLLAVSGELDLTLGGKPLKLTEASNKRRTIYGFVSRRKLDGTLALFDFPNPNATSDRRFPTATPLQQLFFLNSWFLQQRAEAFAARLQQSAASDAQRIQQAYRILFYREPLQAELETGLAYLRSDSNAWPRYAQVLLSSNEMVFY